MKCEYCRQKVPVEREAELAAHFNTSDANLKAEIERAINDNRAIYEEVERIRGLSEQVLYPELREEFSVHAGALGSQQSDILKYLEGLQSALSDKLARRTESYSLTFPSLTGANWNDALSSINALIKRHNSETDDFEQRLDANFAKIETHYLSDLLPNESANLG